MIAKLTGSLWVRALLTIAVLTYLATRIDLGQAAASLARLDVSAALLTLALLAIDRLIVVWRWLILLRAVGARVATATAIRLYFVSSFVGGFLLAGVGADAARAFALSRVTTETSQAVASVAVDRALGLISMLLAALLGILVWAPRLDDNMAWVLRMAAAASAAIVVAFLWADRAMRAVLPRAWHASRTGTRLLGVADALAAYRGHRGAVLFVLALSLGVQFLRILQAYTLGRGIGIDVPLAYYLVFMPLGLIALLLPISISGFGIPQGIIVWLLQPVGVPQPEALALSTLIVLTGIIGNLPGGWLYLMNRESPR